MSTIYLVRHGQNEDNAAGILNGHRDLPLTEKGREQALESAQHIKDLDLQIDRIISSPLSRAYDTACAIAELNNLAKPEVVPLLIERDFGVMSGVEQTRIKELCSPDIIETETVTYFLSPEGAETFPDLLARAKSILEHINTQYPGQRVLAVTHGDIGKMIYAEYYRLPWEDVLVNFHFGNCEVLELSTEAINQHRHIIQIQQHNT